MSEIASHGQLRLGLLRVALLTVPGVLLLGTLSGVLSGSGDNGWYDGLAKPGFTPPDWAFGVVWPVLYIMQGLGLALVWEARGAPLRSRAIGLFAAQFAANLLWSPVFFGAHEPRAALYLLAVILGLSLATTVHFFRVRRTAGLLMLPYLAWLLYAAALNQQIIALNPDVGTLF